MSTRGGRKEGTVSAEQDRVTAEAELEKRVGDALRACFDPEIPVNIYDLGLIYGITVDTAGAVSLQMTLTAPNCPAAQTLPAEVERKVRAVTGVTAVKVDVVFDPPWNSCMMSDAAKLQLGLL
jgi:FeS assembly SUF system protein